MDYFTWSKEYYRDAQNIGKVIKKYEAQLKSRDCSNFEYINSTIASYRSIYYELLNTAKMLEARGREQQNAA